MLDGGLLKRTVFDVSFENAAGDESLLSVGLFASGLGSVASGESSESEEEDSSPTAGMNLGFLDSYLRPYVFFRSTSELMGHAWSGTASEQTPVLQVGKKSLKEQMAQLSLLVNAQLKVGAVFSEALQMVWNGLPVNVQLNANKIIELTSIGQRS
ncbi:hypothetical protein AVEN_213469-1, partial [Araneus ventricosus]